ncbi:MAG: hypothetical protein ACE14P_03440 [Methanotrichaceae archaeon]
MRNIIVGIISIFAVLAVAIIPSGFAESVQPSYKAISGANNRLLGASLDLTGVYTTKPSGTYYITQVGNNVYWYGEEKSQNPSWSNIAYGTIKGNTLTLNWADVPKGSTHSSGTLTLSVTRPAGMTVLTVTQQTGGFGTTQIIRFDNAAVLPA